MIAVNVRHEARRAARLYRHLGRLAVVLSSAGALVGCGKEGDGDAEARAAAPDTAMAASKVVVMSAAQIEHGGVHWAPAEANTVAAAAEAPGRLVPNEDRTARLGAPAQGRVVAVHVQPGDRVARGQPLVTLQSPGASAARADFSKATAEVSSRRAATAYARSALERAERLLAAKAIARQDVERARADDELAQSALAQAQAELDRARTALEQMGVSDASGAMVVRAPLSGVVLSREAAPGSVVDAGASLVTVADVGTLWLDISAPDRVTATLRPGAGVRFTVPAFAADTFTARVQSVGSALDSATRTLPVRALVQNGLGRLRPEMFATVWIEGGAARAAVAVPDAAVQLLDEKPVVFVAMPDGTGGARFERRDVEVGAKMGGRTQIVRGLNPGESVVVDGAFAVKSEFARSKMPSEG